MAPSEFWGITPHEFWIIHNAKLPQKMYGKLSESEADRLLKMIDESGEEWQIQQ